DALLGEPLRTEHVNVFAISRHPVSVSEYAVFLDDTKHALPVNWAAQRRRPDGAVEGITWADAVTYCRWLTLRLGRTYRLPDERAWEKAARACARLVQADPTDPSVGRSGKPNVPGIVELDASIVDGTTHRVGAVAALVGYLYPITIARAVMERTPHVMLVGAGAARFAREIGAAKAQNLTASTRELWVERLRKAHETPASVRRRARLLPVVRKTVRSEEHTPELQSPDQHLCRLLLDTNKSH